mmetsp:Transcript_35224/g.79481  ORF Transcript_35224/g.79481 Transcript_35224/m.79481 type:complete len:200 (-) Transcript_35224:135-734(-)
MPCRAEGPLAVVVGLARLSARARRRRRCAALPALRAGARMAGATLKARGRSSLRSAQVVSRPLKSTGRRLGQLPPLPPPLLLLLWRRPLRCRCRRKPSSNRSGGAGGARRSVSKKSGRPRPLRVRRRPSLFRLLSGPSSRVGPAAAATAAAVSPRLKRLASTLRGWRGSPPWGGPARARGGGPGARGVAPSVLVIGGEH